MKDPFSTLGVAARFDLDPRELQRAYLRRAAETHPDLEGDQGDSASAELNKARAVLEDPEARANALLQLLGGPSKEDDRSLPEGFLAEVMDVRQEVEESLGAGGGAARERWERWAQERRSAYIEKLKGLLGGAGPPSAGVLRTARRELNAWRYIERLIEQLKPQYDPARQDFSS
jgi:curved DNA-binding protein CbpA